MRRLDRAPPRTGATTRGIVRELEEAFATIANELNIPIDRVRIVVREPRLLSSERRQCREQAILRLRRKGFYNQEIAEVLGWSGWDCRKNGAQAHPGGAA